jgi:alpha-galactosidase
MGWNGYNAFGCAPELNEAKLKETVQALKASGMQSSGYRFVNLDACWQLPRSGEGKRAFKPDRLPSGVAWLSDYLHDLGFSFGVFSPIQDCREEPGGMTYEAADAQTYEEWGVDYLKYTNCNPKDSASERSIFDLATALAGLNRPITLSIAAPPFHEWMPDSAQLWRTSGSAAPTWSSLVESIDATVPLAAYARPGAFNDPDMLEIGNGTLTAGEKRVQFAVWSILSAPLLAGNDLTVMTEETRAILTNHHLIALNQDPLGLQAALIRREGEVDILAKPLAECGARAVVLWNRSEVSAEVSLTWQDMWLEPATASVHDLWTDSSLTVEPGGFTVTVPGHDAVALRVNGVERPRPSGRVALSDLRWTYATNGFGPIELDRTNGEDRALDGQPIRLRNAEYPKGLGVHAPSLIRYRLGRACTRFIADIGIDDDQQGRGSVQFEVWADGERLFQSGLLTGTSPGRAVNLDVSGRRELRLFVRKAGDSYALDHAVWAGATLECGPGTDHP